MKKNIFVQNKMRLGKKTYWRKSHELKCWPKYQCNDTIFTIRLFYNMATNLKKQA